VNLPQLLRRPLPLLPLALRRCSTSGWLGLRNRRLRSKHLHKGLISALLVGISAAHADRSNQLIVHDDW
jgi:hypothetical protein